MVKKKEAIRRCVFDLRIVADCLETPEDVPDVQRHIERVLDDGSIQDALADSFLEVASITLLSFDDDDDDGIDEWQQHVADCKAQRASAKEQGS
jgi:hypothetical protein